MWCIRRSCRTMSKLCLIYGCNRRITLSLYSAMSLMFNAVIAITRTQFLRKIHHSITIQRYNMPRGKMRVARIMRVVSHKSFNKIKHLFYLFNKSIKESRAFIKTTLHQKIINSCQISKNMPINASVYKIFTSHKMIT